MNIDEAMEHAEVLQQEAANGEWLLYGEKVVIFLAAEVKRLREFTESQRRDNEQLRDRLKVLESQGQPPTVEESRGTFEATLAIDGIGIARYKWDDKFDYIDYEARKRWYGWQAAIEWVTKRQ